MEKNNDFEVKKDLMYLESSVFKSKDGTKDLVKHRFFDFNSTIDVFDKDDKNILQQIQQHNVKERDIVVCEGNLRIKQVANNFSYFNFDIKKLTKKI